MSNALSTHRFLAWFLAVTCLVWQLDWAAVAATEQAVSAHRQCACRGTVACCCEHPQAAAESGTQAVCHLARTPRQSEASDVVLRPSGCGPLPAAVVPGAARDALVPLRATPSGVAAASVARARHPSQGSYQPVFLDPPFVPPEHLTA